jgi:hypothetical protein
MVITVIDGIAVTATQQFAPKGRASLMKIYRRALETL